MMLVVWCFFFFKQKTAYEMRISDWSQTCALPICRDRNGAAPRRDAATAPHRPNGGPCRGWRGHAPDRPSRPAIYGWWRHSHDRHGHYLSGRTRPIARHRAAPPRSEEHTSELQSLMRNSYAVFHLIKKQPKNTDHHEYT